MLITSNPWALEEIWINRGISFDTGETSTYLWIFCSLRIQATARRSSSPMTTLNPYDHIVSWCCCTKNLDAALVKCFSFDSTHCSCVAVWSAMLSQNSIVLVLVTPVVSATTSPIVPTEGVGVLSVTGAGVGDRRFLACTERDRDVDLPFLPRAMFNGTALQELLTYPC